VTPHQLRRHGAPPGEPLARRRLLFVHAHPDDEASKGAATAARYVDEGARVTLVTCTGGEAGEILNPALAHVTSDELPAVRAEELRASVDVIGFAATYLLGYPDSGWYEDLADVPAGTFWHVELDEAAARLASVLRLERPQVVVTYPEDGGYPHPDHIKVHAVTMRAVELAADPDHAPDTPPWATMRVYASTVYPLAKLVALHDAHEAAGLPSPFAEWLKRRADDEPAPNVVVQVGAWLARRDAALLAHATQVDPAGPWFAHDRDIELRVAPYEAFLFLQGQDAMAVGEHDLFAGLDL